jgi:hypothetical protein
VFVHSKLVLKDEVVKDFYPGVISLKPLLMIENAPIDVIINNSELSHCIVARLEGKTLFLTIDSTRQLTAIMLMVPLE